MTEINFKDLTEEEKKLICNGCGGKGGLIDPPEFFFTADCNRHDFSYWRGCTEDDRKKADKGFYNAMKEDVRNQKWFKRPFFYLMAWIYYRAVRWQGKKFFHYADKQRTREDLDRKMNRVK